MDMLSDIEQEKHRIRMQIMRYVDTETLLNLDTDFGGLWPLERNRIAALFNLPVEYIPID